MFSSKILLFTVKYKSFLFDQEHFFVYLNKYKQH